MDFMPLLLCDFYKVSHREQYPNKTEIVYSTWTPRSNKYFNGTKKIVNFGQQMFIKKYLIDYFNKNFFERSKDEVVTEYVRYIKFALGNQNPYSTHIAELHDLGYLPLKIKSLPEGTLVPFRVPVLTVENTDKRFFWLTNFIETLFSCEMWITSTSATIAHEYNKILNMYAKETNGDASFVQFQGHDFSMRGMSSVESAANSGLGHLLSFVGTDTIPAIYQAEKYYNADIEKELIGTSIPATEHSVMCAGGSDNEFDTYKRLINEVYPSGFVSIVSDTWDLWSCIENIIKPLKEDIMNRDGRVVIRPDSGDPVKIICGDEKEEGIAKIGLIEALWNIFGGTINENGYKVLDPHIGAIYGDSITIDRCKDICEGLKSKGFASINMVFGIGSYTYQYNTRDTAGWAMKSTMCVIDGFQKHIFKDPMTDDGIKKSNIGRVAVIDCEKDGLKYVDGLINDDFLPDKMRTIYENGNLLVDESFDSIKKRLIISR